MTALRNRRSTANEITLDTLLPPNHNFVTAMGAVMVVGGIIFFAFVYFFASKANVPWFFTICIIALIATGATGMGLARRSYRTAVAILCGADVTIVIFGSLFAFGMTRSGAPLTAVWGVILGGLLLGRRAATLLTLWAALLMGVAVILQLTNSVPPPFFSDENQLLLINIQGLFITLAMFYPLMILFLNVINRALLQARTRTMELEAALKQLHEKQALERATGAAIIGVMNSLRQIDARQSQSIEEQVTALAQVTATVEELAQTATQIASVAADVDHTAAMALTAASESQGAVQNGLGAVLEIKAQVGQIVKRTLELNERIHGISNVVDVVGNITAQTHLLALNASIEAAGAGQAGERFGIVASEVKKLAQQSQTEAAHIRDLVAQVQRANAASVMATEQGLKDSDKGMAQARIAAEANVEVIELVTTTSARARAITMSTAQQQSASEQVVDTMRHLRSAAQEVAQTTASINATISELSALAVQLGALLEQDGGESDGRQSPSVAENRESMLRLALPGVPA